MTVSRRASPNSFCAASALREGSIWKETASLLTETHSQARLERSSPRSSWTRQLVSSAWRSAALFWCARIASASGSSSGTNRFRLSASVPGETVSPWADIHAATRCTRRKQAQCSNRNHFEGRAASRPRTSNSILCPRDRNESSEYRDLPFEPQARSTTTGA